MFNLSQDQMSSQNFEMSIFKEHDENEHFKFSDANLSNDQMNLISESLFQHTEKFQIPENYLKFFYGNHEPEDEFMNEIQERVASTFEVTISEEYENKEDKEEEELKADTMLQNISTDSKVVMENSEAQGKLAKIVKNIEEDDSSDFSEKDPRSPGRPKKRYDIPPQDLFVFL